MPIIGLSDWDKSGQLSPYKQGKGDQLLGGLKTILEQTTKAAQDKRLRQAAAQMLNIDPNSLRDYTSEEIKGIMTDATKEKFRASLKPAELTPDEKIANEIKLEEAKAGAKAKAESEGLRNLLNMFPGQTQEPAVTGDILSDTQTAQSGGLNITPGDILKGRLKKQYGIEIQPTAEEIKAKSQVESEAKAAGETLAQQEKKKAESMANFKIAKNKLMTTAGAFKAMIEAEGAGRKGGFKRIWTGATGQNPYVKAFEGQLVEAASALAKLAAPSARVGQEIIAQFKKTLPTKFSNYNEFTNQIRFSLHNAYSTALANAGEDYTPEIRAEVDRMVEEIVNVPPLKTEEINTSGEEDTLKRLGLDPNKFEIVR